MWLDRPDLRQDALPVAGLGQAKIHDHVDLVCAVADGVLCLKDLDLGGVVAVWEAHHRADLQALAHIACSAAHIPGRDADGGGPEGQALVTQLLYLIPGSGGGQQGVVHPLKQFLMVHSWILLVEGRMRSST